MVEAERNGRSRSGEGTEFRLVAEFLGRKTELTYRIVEYDPGASGHASAARTRPWSRSTGSRSSRPTEGTRVTYDADLALKGLLRIADPLLGLAFNRVGDRALDGLRDTLGSRQPQTAAASVGTEPRRPSPPAARRPARAAHLHRRRVPPRAAGARRRMAAVAGRPRGAPLGRRRLRIAGPVLRVFAGPVVHRRWHGARGRDRRRARPHDHGLHRRREGRARTRTGRHRHDRRPARRPLGPHPRPRTRRLRRREDERLTAALERSSDDA